MMSRSLTACALLAVSSSFVLAGSIDSERLKLIQARLQESVADGSISGAVYLAAYHGQIVAHGAVGFSDIENRRPMREDTIVQIMSQTKSFTGVAAMMLVEEGKLDLTRPVQDYLPEFKGQLVDEKRPDGSIATHPPEHPMLVWQLMCHTSGFAFLPSEGPYSRINFTLDATLEDAVRAYAREHLQNEPGKKYAYSNMGIATLGRIIEVVSGQEYSRFVRSRILEPLGMSDTFFYPPDSKKPRIAMIYQHENGKLVLSRGKAQAGDPAAYRAGAKYPGPELGLYSTAADLFRFYQMLANGGTFNGRRYLSTQSVEAMRQDYTPDHSGYGLTVSVRNGPASWLNLISPGTFGHGGAFGTGGSIDPKTDLVLIFLPQMNDGTASTASHVFAQITESAVRPTPSSASSAPASHAEPHTLQR
jgi:CubicO group peptidase (beta-lactamase class C family)